MIAAYKHQLPVSQVRAVRKTQLTSQLPDASGLARSWWRRRSSHGNKELSASAIPSAVPPPGPRGEKRNARETTQRRRARTDARRERGRPSRARPAFPVRQAAAYPNSKWPPGSWKLPAPNDPFLLPRRTQRGCLQLVTTTPTPTPGRRPRVSALAVIAREDLAGRGRKWRSLCPAPGAATNLPEQVRDCKSLWDPPGLRRFSFVRGVSPSPTGPNLWRLFPPERLCGQSLALTNAVYCCAFNIHYLSTLRFLHALNQPPTFINLCVFALLFFFFLINELHRSKLIPL